MINRRWKPPSDFVLPEFSGPLALARGMEHIAALMATKKMPPNIGSAVVYALSQASKAYTDAAKFQRDMGGEPPVVLAHGRKVKGFRLVFDFEREAEIAEAPKEESPDAA